MLFGNSLTALLVGKSTPIKLDEHLLAAGGKPDTFNRTDLGK